MPELSTLGAPIKTAYDAQPNTNPFTDAEQAKLAGIQPGAQVNPVNVSAFANDAGYVDETEAAAAAPVQSINTRTGEIVLDKNDVGLGNVNNTADADKPISTATATALGTKVSSIVAGITGADVITNIVSLTQAEYDAIVTKNASTLYVVT